MVQANSDNHTQMLNGVPHSSKQSTISAENLPYMLPQFNLVVFTFKVKDHMHYISNQMMNSSESYIKQLPLKHLKMMVLFK